MEGSREIHRTWSLGRVVVATVLPKHLDGSVIEDHVRTAVQRTIEQHRDTFREHLLAAAHDGYEHMRDCAESEAELAMDAMKDFGEELGIYP